MSELDKIRIRLSALEILPTATALISVITLIQVGIIWFFYSHGLTDLYLFTLIPVGVIIALISNWRYLTGKLAVIPKVSQKPSSSKASMLSSIFKSRAMEIAARSAIIALAPFIILNLVAFSLPALARVLVWLPGGGSQTLSFIDYLANTITSFRMTAPVWKYVYLEISSTIVSTLVTLFVGWRH